KFKIIHTVIQSDKINSPNRNRHSPLLIICPYTYCIKFQQCQSSLNSGIFSHSLL
ncbi:hypothetical protein C0J52_14326, partial [Blattella germanica]